MSADFGARVIGMLLFALIGARLGVDTAGVLGLNDLLTSVIFALVGMLFGLVVTPWITTRPLRFMSRLINEVPMEVIFTSFMGLMFGLIISLLAAYPLSLLPPPLNNILPPAVAVIAGYLGLTLLSIRSRDVWSFLSEWLGIGSRRPYANAGSDRLLLVDTSVLIDGRLVDVASTGFLGGTLIIPRFVIDELHQVADSADPLRRNRGRRGLDTLKQLQGIETLPMRIVEDDIEAITEVDDKLIALAIQLKGDILTIDFPLNQIAAAQGVQVLNLNQLANAVRAAYIPGETFPLHIIQEGTEERQGVGYLEDGTMVIVKDGKNYLDRTIYVTVTKMINRETGRIIFATPEGTSP